MHPSTLLLTLLLATLTLATPLPLPLPISTPTQPQNFDTLSTLSTNLAESAPFSVLRNDLQLDLCRRVTVIFARGTSEPGNVGSLVGPPFFTALEAVLGPQNVLVQGVDYPASIEGYLRGGDSAGAQDLAGQTNLAATRCPDTQIVLAGYSQGAQVVHLGTKLFPASSTARVKAVVLFGDPDRGQPLPGIPADGVKTFCFDGDLICDGAPIVLPAHLSYAVVASPAAAFVVSKLS